jgi:formamidopyrimidine-DNA glycosylase
VRFSNGYHLAYDAQRKLGEIALIRDKAAYLAQKEIGMDALSPDCDDAALRDALRGRRGMIKSALMNQKLVAGIGNIYADEILFQAHIHPKTPVNALDEPKLHTLFQTMKDVLQTAIEHQADPARFPDSFLIPHREQDARCPQCSGHIDALKVSGRTSYYCPACQPLL